MNLTCTVCHESHPDSYGWGFRPYGASLTPVCRPCIRYLPESVDAAKVACAFQYHRRMVESMAPALPMLRPGHMDPDTGSLVEP